MNKFPNDTKTATVDEAKEWLRKEIFEEGALCPCCTQFAKVYRRPFNTAMAYAIIVFAQRLKVGVWTDIPEFLEAEKHSGIVRSREWTRLRFWKLIEPKEDEIREDGSEKTGIYRLTQAGRDFAFGVTEEAHSIFMYDGRMLRKSPEMVSIREALGKKFNYDELMAPALS